MSRCVVAPVAFLATVALLKGPLAAQPEAKPAEKPPLKSREMMALLQETIDMTDLQAPMTLKEALAHFQDKLSKKYKQQDVLPMLVDAAAFKAEEPDAPDIYLTEVKFPPFPMRMPVGMALRVALSKVPTGNATYLLRQGVVEITTMKEASPKQLLRQRVVASFSKFPLDEAFETLSEQTGLHVLLDPRAGEKLKTRVTATFSNNVSLEGALRLLAEMADLKADITPDAVFITTPATAAALHKERRDAAAEAVRDRWRELWMPPPEDEPPQERRKKEVGTSERPRQ
jgi:hypothetical protein